MDNLDWILVVDADGHVETPEARHAPAATEGALR